MTIRGEGEAFVAGVSPQEVFDFVVAGRWFDRAVTQEVQEIARLLSAGERGRGLEAL